MTKREQSRVDRAMKRFADERKRLNALAEAGPSFTPQSDGSGVEQNGRLRQLDALNQHRSPEGFLLDGRDWTSAGGTDEAQERRVAGFPSRWGRLAREAMAMDAAPEPVEPEPIRHPWPLLILVIVCGVILLVGAAWWAWEAYKLWGRP